MKLNVYSIVLLLLAVGLAGAPKQAIAQHDKESKEKLESAKIGMITTRLNLTEEQAPKFWTIYNDYRAKKKDMRGSFRKLKMRNVSASASDDEIRADLKEMMSLKQKEVDMENDYIKQLLKVISARQIAELYKTEHQFTKMLLEKLENKPKDSKVTGK